MKKFFIIGEQRSGTISFGDLLDSHPEISVFGEVFLNVPSGSNKHSYFDFLGSNLSRGPDRLYPQFDFVRDNLNDFIGNLEAKSKGGALGIHLKYDQLNYVSELTKHLSEMGFICFNLLRQNILDIVISQYVLELRHKNFLLSHSGVNDEPECLDVSLPSLPEIVSKIYEIRQRIIKNRAYLSRCFGKKYHEFFYPEYFQEYTYNKALDILEIDRCKLKCTLKKTGDTVHINDKWKLDLIPRNIYML